MSEQAPRGPENLHNVEHQEHSEQHKRPEAHKPSHHETEPNQPERHKIEEIRSSVKHEAISGKDVVLETAKNEKHNSNSQTLVTRDLRENMLQRTLTRTRKQLPGIARPFSKVVHTKPVEALSNAGEKTIARPAGLLGGGMAALIGSLFSFYTAKHYGYRYNFLLYILLFVAGYIVFTVGEIIIVFLHRQKHGKL